jgi:hypothetical protein
MRYTLSWHRCTGLQVDGCGCFGRLTRGKQRQRREYQQCRLGVAGANWHDLSLDADLFALLPQCGDRIPRINSLGH